MEGAAVAANVQNIRVQCYQHRWGQWRRKTYIERSGTFYLQVSVDTRKKYKYVKIILICKQICKRNAIDLAFLTFLTNFICYHFE